MNMSSDNDRQLLFSTIKLLPNAIDLRVYNRNKLALKMEELVMSQDKTVLVQTAEEISSAVQENLKLSKPEEVKHIKNDMGTYLSEPKVINHDKSFTKDHANALCDMLKNGKTDDALGYLKQFTDEAIADEQIQQTALSQIPKTAEEQNLETEKNQKDEFKLSLLGEIGKLTDILHKLP